MTKKMYGVGSGCRATHPNSNDVYKRLAGKKNREMTIA